MDKLPPAIDVCCSIRAFWFDKKDSRALFLDRREGRQEVNRPGRRDMVVAPDIIADFTKLPFESNSFWHVVFDPPHLKNSGTGNIGFHYGRLSASWQDDMRGGFKECFRILKPNGTLIFKWNETDYPLSQILKLTEQKPLYGHKSGKLNKTHWVAFIKGSSE